MANSGRVSHYRDSGVWQKAMDLVVACYRISSSFPAAEAYGLTSQLRRAAVSVPANIAEGHARRRTKEYLHHLDIAYGSLAEVETHVMLAGRLGYATEDAVCPLLTQAAEVGRMINGLCNALNPES